jgi:hypothetical protein
MGRPTPRTGAPHARTRLNHRSSARRDHRHPHLHGPW